MTRTARIVSLCLGAWVTACSSSGVKGDESAELTSDTDESSATDASSDGGDGDSGDGDGDGASGDGDGDGDGEAMGTAMGTPRRSRFSMRPMSKGAFELVLA